MSLSFGSTFRQPLALLAHFLSIISALGRRQPSRVVVVEVAAVDVRQLARPLPRDGQVGERADGADEDETRA